MPAFQAAELTKALVRCLSQFDKGTRLTYKDIGKHVDAQVDSRTPNLVTARKILERDHAAVWGCIRPRVGLWRLNDPEIAALQRNWWLNGARNKLTSGAKQADVVEIELLDIKQQTNFAMSSIQREIARDTLSKATLRRVEKTARGSSNDLPSFNAVEWMIALSPRRSKNPPPP